MNRAETWREFLGEIVSSAKERKRLANQLEINAATLTRWIENRSDPRQDNVLALLEALPHHRQRLTELLILEFPHYFSETSPNAILPEIPSNFYYHVIKESTAQPPQISAIVIPTLIAQQALGHLDPQKRGMAVVVIECVPPPKGEKVRSLRILQGRGTPPWDRMIEEATQLFGKESPVGHAVEQGRAIVLPNADVRKQQYPLYTPTASWTESEMAFPIMRHNKLVGSLYIASTQRDYFTPEMQTVGLSYSMLLTIAFETARFYEINTINLGLMPSREQQHSVLIHLQSTIKQVMVEYKRNGHILTRVEAEPLAWSKLEQELFRISAESDF